MLKEAARSYTDLSNNVALNRIQHAIEQARPCVIVSPPHFGQLQILQLVAAQTNRSLHQVKLSDQELSDPTRLRELISDTQSLLQQASTDQKAILLIEHKFSTSSLQTLKSARQCYFDTLKLNRIDQVLPVLCTPFAAHLFTHPPVESETSGELFNPDTRQNQATSNQNLDCLIIHTHDLFVSMPVGTQQLLNSAPPHLHQGLLGIARLAECWPAMGALLNAKLKGLSLQEELQQSGLQDIQATDKADINIPASALKTICSELLNDFQSILLSFADSYLTQSEQLLIAHLSLFPPNIYPYLQTVQKIIPQSNELVQGLCAKNVLVFREEEGPQGSQPLISFASLPWRFFAQGHLRRSCSAMSVDQYISRIDASLQAESLHNHSDYFRTLAIEFNLSAQNYDRAISLIVQQAQAEDTPELNKTARIQQAVSWFKFVPQRLINQNSQARVIQSYHRLVTEQFNFQQSTAPRKSEANQRETHQNILLKGIKEDQNPHNSDAHMPRIAKSNTLSEQLSPGQIPVSLQGVEIPSHSIRPTQASLLLDIQQHLEDHNTDQLLNLARLMIDQALNQHKPELFLHGICYLWYHYQACDGLNEFRKVLIDLLDEKRLASHLHEFHFWLNQIVTVLDKDTSTQTPVEVLKVALPNMPHMTSLGQNLLGYMTSYINALLAINLAHCSIAQERIQEATYYGMNLPDNFCQTLMPLWLLETLSYLQHNRISEALTYIRNTVSNNQIGSVRIHNRMLAVFAALADRMATDEPDKTELFIPATMHQVQALHQQLQALSLLWQHAYKKSDRFLTQCHKKGSNEPQFLKNFIDWTWFGPSSWYLLKNNQHDSDKKNSQNNAIELQLSQLEHYYAETYEFDEAYLSLSKREAEILGLVVKGCSNEEISNLLCRSLGTIKLHVHSIYKKLNVSNRVNAIKKCQVSGFFSFSVAQ